MFTFNIDRYPQLLHFLTFSKSERHGPTASASRDLDLNPKKEIGAIESFDEEDAATESVELGKEVNSNEAIDESGDEDMGDAEREPNDSNEEYVVDDHDGE